MFLDGPFMQVPFLAFSGPIVPVVGPDQMLSDDAAEIVYFAEIEPWVLADRS